jgi:predicted homoserine dehydrogenase-like protein
VILVDRALEARASAGEPLRIGLVGAGFAGRAVARRLAATRGLKLVAIGTRSPERALEAYRGAGIDDAQTADTAAELERAVAAGRYVVTRDPTALCAAPGIDVVVEATGTIEEAAGWSLAAIAARKHLVLLNAELDATLGPLLAVRATAAGVVYTNAEGDQPAEELNLLRFVRGIGMEPLLCGSVKGLLDHYRTPETQASFARRWGQQPAMVTSFADGTKISFEQAVVANATGFRVAARGMRGYRYPGHLEDPAHLAMYDVDELRQLGGAVDYVLGAQPGGAVYVLAVQADAVEQQFLDLYKVGPGPLYCFYNPYHLCHFTVPFTVARAALFGDAAVAPLGAPVVEVVATAKRDLAAGEVLDGIGGYTSYGQCENADVAARERLLPMGLAAGCRVIGPLRRDEVLTYDDVELPEGRLADALRDEQAALLADASSSDGAGARV